MTVNFGRDTSCTTSLRTGRFATGVRLVAEAAFRRVTTPRGMLRGGEDEANYGIDLHELCGSVSPARDAAALPGRVEAELTKDERIQTVKTTVVISVDGPETSFDVVIVATTTLGPFRLQIGINQLTVELLNLTAV